MSLAGQVDWKRKLTVYALAIIGKPVIAAPPAAAEPAKNLRRVGVDLALVSCMFILMYCFGGG